MIDNLFDKLLKKIDKEKKEVEEKLLNFDIFGDISFAVEIHGIDEAYDETKRFVKLKVNTLLFGEIDISTLLNEDYFFLGESLSFLNDKSKEKFEEINKKLTKNILIKYRDYENGIIVLPDRKVISTKLAEKLIEELEEYSKMSLSSKTKKQIKEDFIKKFNEYVNNHNLIVWGEYVKRIADKDLETIEDIKNIKPVYDNIQDKHIQAKKDIKDVLVSIVKKLD